MFAFDKTYLRVYYYRQVKLVPCRSLVYCRLEPTIDNYIHITQAEP